MHVFGDICDHETWPSGWTVRHVAETGSTNDDLLRDAESGVVGDRHVLFADHQLAGRGRLDRRWDAPPGANLLVSIHFAHAPAHPADVMHRAGLALVHAIDALAGAGGSGSVLGLGMKWPNDVLLDGRKLAGVLAQRSTATPGIVVGIGANVGWAPDGAARLHDVAAVTPSALLVALLRSFDALPDDIGPAYRERLATIGRRVRVELPAGASIVGTAVDVDQHGRLVVEGDDGGVHRFDVGDVVHLRPDL